MRRLTTISAALCTIALLLMLTVPAFAQEGETAKATQDPNAIPLLLLLLGIFAILGVGLTYMQPAARRAPGSGSSASVHDEDEDEE